MSLNAGMTKWARSNDPILQRYSTGGLARLAVSGRQAFQAVDTAGGLQAMIGALTSSDGQTACYAAGALGASDPFASVYLINRFVVIVPFASRFQPLLA